MKSILAPQLPTRPARSLLHGDASILEVQQLPPELEQVYRDLRQMALLDGVPNATLRDAIERKQFEILSLDRDQIVLSGANRDELADRAFFVLGGQVALARFPEGKLDELQKGTGKKKKKSKQEPLIRIAERHLTHFVMGDLFQSQAITDEGAALHAFFTLEPTGLLSASKAFLTELSENHPFFAERMRRALDLARQRTGSLGRDKLRIMDFFIRHGISVASTVRVRQIDRCIECKQCEIACEERYGAKRLTIGGPRLGMLDFVQTCHTCEDQRCVTACNFDAIAFDETAGEVRINEKNCTGCAACAIACPYNAIDMVNVADASPLFLLRMNEHDAFAQTKKAKLKRIPNKCDHCIDYGDQACISHCPTGALLEMNPVEIFQDGSDLARSAAQDGYDHTLVFDATATLPPAPFRKGLGITWGAVAKLPPRQVSPTLYWSLGLGTWLLCLVEILLRKFAPLQSLAFFWNRVVDGMDAESALGAVDFRAGSTLAVRCGIVGAVLILFTMAYVLRQRVRFLQRTGTNQTWFDFHLMCGIVGPLFVTLHTALRLDNWVSLAFWSMVGVVISGLMGRFLFTQLPKELGASELDLEEHEHALSELEAKHPDAVALARLELDELRHELSQTSIMSIRQALRVTLGSPFMRPCLTLQRLWRLSVIGTGIRPTFAICHHAGALLTLEKRRATLPRVQDLLRAWKKVHIPLAITMGVLVILHIVLAIKYSL